MADYSENKQILKKGHEFCPLANHIAPRLEPVLRKKGGLDVQIVENWPQIVGEDLSTVCVPFKIKRQRVRAGGQEMVTTLFIACEGFVSVKIQHRMDEIIKKTNQFIEGQGKGKKGIDKIKIVQKPIHDKINIPPLRRPLTQMQQAWLEEQSSLIIDKDLRGAVIRLGKNLIETGFTP